MMPAICAQWLLGGYLLGAGATPRARGVGTPAAHPGSARRGAPATLAPASARGPRRSAPRPRGSGGARDTGGS
jgi:hypothetical protein